MSKIVWYYVIIIITIPNIYFFPKKIKRCPILRYYAHYVVTRNIVISKTVKLFQFFLFALHYYTYYKITCTIFFEESVLEQELHLYYIITILQYFMKKIALPTHETSALYWAISTFIGFNLVLVFHYVSAWIRICSPLLI